MDDRPRGILDRLEGALDQFGPRLREHGDRRVGGNQRPRRPACGRTRSPSSRRKGNRPRSPSPPAGRAGRTCAACARRPSASRAPGFRREDPSSTRSGPGRRRGRATCDRRARRSDMGGTSSRASAWLQLLQWADFSRRCGSARRVCRVVASPRGGGAGQARAGSQCRNHCRPRRSGCAARSSLSKA